MPTTPAMRVTSGRASRNSGDSLRLPGAETKRRDHVAIAVAEGDDVVAFQLLVPVEADVVATLFGGRRRAVTVNDGDIKKLVVVKLHLVGPPTTLHAIR